MLKEIVYVALYVTDQEKALAYYTNVLGFEKRFDNPTPDKTRFLTIGVPGQAVELVLWPGTPGSATPSYGRSPATYTVEVEDCRKAFDTLKARGANFVTDVLEFPWGHVAQLRDPDGNLLAIRQARRAA